MDLYDILEIKPTASEIEIKKAYLKLIKIYHPDKNKDINSQDKFHKIQTAYEILSNTTSRQEYQKMSDTQKYSFVDILEKIIGEKINVGELKKYGINIDTIDWEYIQNNFINFFKSINIIELLNFFKKGIVPKKNFNNIINCSDSDYDIYDETHAEYYYFLPISFQKYNSLDIKLELSVKLSDITSNLKKKIKLKRKINDKEETNTFIFNLSNPYIVFIGAGDYYNGDYGNLIIKLNLPNNLYWNDNLILIEQTMSLYEMIYGIDIKLNIGDDKDILINKWIPSRDGFLIEINNSSLLNNYNLNFNLAIKLVLDYQDSNEKENILKLYFS